MFTHVQGWIKESGKKELDDELIGQMSRILYTWTRGVCIFELGWGKTPKPVLMDVDIITDSV